MHELETILDRYRDGGLTRRQALTALASVVAAGATSTRAQSPATLKALGINHLALRVTDVAAMRDFMKRHFAMRTIREFGDQRCFLQSGEHFVALFRGSKPGLDHTCFTVAGYDPDATKKVLADAGLRPRQQENRLYFEGPEGFTFQVSGLRDAWPEPG